MMYLENKSHGEPFEYWPPWIKWPSEPIVYALDEELKSYVVLPQPK